MHDLGRAELDVERGMGNVAENFREQGLSRASGAAGDRPHPLLDCMKSAPPTCS